MNETSNKLPVNHFYGIYCSKSYSSVIIIKNCYFNNLLNIYFIFLVDDDDDSITSKRTLKEVSL